MHIDTEHFKKLLVTEKETLEKELLTVGRKNKNTKGDWEAVETDMNTDRAEDMEVADGLENYDNNVAILNQLELRLAEVNSALSKIHDGTYGICEVSGEEIELDRLEANPAAKTNKAHMND